MTMFWGEKITYRRLDQPSALTYYFLGNLRTERRFLCSNREPVPYMQNHKEYVYEHIQQCVRFAKGLFIQHPELRRCFNEKLVIHLLWFHEVEEIIDGDKSWFTKLGDQRKRIGGTDDEKIRHQYREKLGEIFSIFFSENKKIKYWVDRVDQFDNYAFTSNHSILLAKLIDILVGNKTVLLRGNDLIHTGQSQIDSVGPRFGLVMSKLQETKMMQKNPEVYNFFDDLVFEQVSEYRRHGIYMPYEQRRFLERFA